MFNESIAPRAGAGPPTHPKRIVASAETSAARFSFLPSTGIHPSVFMSFTSLQLDSRRHTGLDQHAARWGTPSGALRGGVCAIAFGLSEMPQRPTHPVIRGRRDGLDRSMLTARQEAIEADVLRYEQSAARNGAGTGGGGRIR